MTHQPDIDECLLTARNMAQTGKDYDSILAFLRQNIENDELIDKTMEDIHEEIVTYQLAKQEKSTSFTMMSIGLLLFSIGVIITFYTVLTLNRQFLLVYGAIIIGAWLAVKNYREWRRPFERKKPQHRFIRRKF